MKALQEEVDLNGLNPFHRAASDHDINLIMELMEIFPGAKSDPRIWLDRPTKHGVTPVHFACMYKHKGKAQEKKRFISYLLENGADPNKSNNYTYFTPLHWACRYGDLDIVKDLLHFGATPFVPDFSGYFPIDFTGFFGNSDVLKALIDFSISRFDDLKLNQYKVETVPPNELKKAPKDFKSLFQYRNAFLLSPFYATKLLFWATRENSVDVETVEKILTEMASYPEGCLPFMRFQTPFHSAAHSGNELKLRMVIDDYLNRKKMAQYA